MAELSLKVKEALPKDAGRAIARIDPEAFKTLAIEVGGVVEIIGKRSAPARVMPCYAEERGKGVIQIDGVTRENCSIGLGEKVKVRRAEMHPAARVTLAALTVGTGGQAEQDMRYLGSLIEGLPVTKGDRVRATLFGSRWRDFKVVETVPDAIVTIGPGTSIRMEESAGEGRAAKVSYEDIGGLEFQIQRIREMIELPLKYPQLFERLGIDAPKGVLLHGPPGTGKTLIARAVANETDAYFTHISGPEIMGKFYGESEGRLRGIFEDAQKHAPAIIFLDEIDAIAPKREEMGGEKQVERRVVAQLLALLDGLESRGQVIVIGATNIPNTLDPALRRPGRFDREIPVPIPNKKGRLAILQIHTRGMPLAKDVTVEKIAEITHGFVGADLEALAREAAMSALRKVMGKIDFQLAEIPYEVIQELEVTMNDFLEALKEVEPSAIREVFVEVPDVRWEDVGGLEGIKEELKEAVEWPLKYSDVFSAANAHPPKGILLHGAPGTGKTLLAKAAAKESGVNFISVKGPALMSKYIGESERAIREVFRTARQASPSILFFDEIESLVPIRSMSGSEVTERVISQFLTEMDGIEELRDVVVLGATNRLDMVDPALLRSGRFDLLLELPEPDEKARLSILDIHTRDTPLGSDVDLKALAHSTDWAVGADIALLCRRAGMFAVREYLSENRKSKIQNPENRKDAKNAKTEQGTGGEIQNPKSKIQNPKCLVVGMKHFEEARRLIQQQNDRRLQARVVGEERV